jgi:hypothetical protein
MVNSARLSCLAYSALLFLYPASLRRHFGEEMIEVFHHEIQDACREEGWMGGLRVWMRAGVDVLTVALPSHLRLLGVSLVSCFTAATLFFVVFRMFLVHPR